MRDLADRDDVAQLVTAFYRAAFADPLIGPVFTDVARLDLEHHLPIMCDFWETVLWGAGLYRRNALQIHLVLHARHPLGAEHFDRWLSLWEATLDASFAGPVAERARVQARRIAGSMQRRLAGRSGSAFETLTRHDEQEHDDVRARL
jgi:hemoglobin